VGGGDVELIKQSSKVVAVTIVIGGQRIAGLAKATQVVADDMKERL
jgi:hypothetical protein